MLTRFQKEISGQLGDYWKRDAEKRMKEYVDKANVDAVVEEDGAIKWKRSGNYLMDDYCEVLEYAEYPFSRAATNSKRDAQVHKELDKYRKTPKIYTAEEISEMKAAFGDGATIVDVISGSTIHL